jgi:succinyl-diaminopimelate desuccinylase
VELESLYKKFPERDEMYDTPESTFEPTKKLENVPSINVIPGEDVIFYDCRILPQYNTDDVIAYVRRKADDIEKKFGVEIEINFPQHVKAARPTPADAPIVQMLKKGIKDIYNAEAKPMGIGGGTVAAFFRRHGYNAAVWSTIDDTCHQPDESARISFMIADTKVFAHLMMQKV